MKFEDMLSNLETNFCSKLIFDSSELEEEDDITE